MKYRAVKMKVVKIRFQNCAVSIDCGTGHCAGLGQGIAKRTGIESSSIQNLDAKRRKETLSEHKLCLYANCTIELFVLSLKYLLMLSICTNNGFWKVTILVLISIV